MEKTTKIPLFRRCVIQNFPFIEEDFDALTDYDLLCKVVEYLNKVIKQTNINSEKVKTLTKYVEHYFDNLDVQEEINNKLDEMAEDGTLAEIMAVYLGKMPLSTLNFRYLQRTIFSTTELYEGNHHAYLQGNCIVNGNVIACLRNHQNADNIVRLVEIDLEDGSVERSAYLELNHGNSVTYNEKDNKLYVASCAKMVNGVYTNDNDIFVIDYDTLTITNTIHTVNIPSGHRIRSVWYDNDTDTLYAGDEHDMYVLDEATSSITQIIPLETTGLDLKATNQTLKKIGNFYYGLYISFLAIWNMDKKLIRVINIDDIQDNEPIGEVEDFDIDEDGNIILGTVCYDSPRINKINATFYTSNITVNTSNITMLPGAISTSYYLYVDANSAEDFENGTSDYPFKSLPRAISCAMTLYKSCTIVIKSGSYDYTYINGVKRLTFDIEGAVTIDGLELMNSELSIYRNDVANSLAINGVSVRYSKFKADFAITYNKFTKSGVLGADFNMYLYYGEADIPDGIFTGNNDHTLIRANYNSTLSVRECTFSNYDGYFAIEAMNNSVVYIHALTLNKELSTSEHNFHITTSSRLFTESGSGMNNKNNYQVNDRAMHYPTCVYIEPTHTFYGEVCDIDDHYTHVMLHVKYPSSNADYRDFIFRIIDLDSACIDMQNIMDSGIAFGKLEFSYNSETKKLSITKNAKIWHNSSTGADGYSELTNDNPGSSNSWCKVTSVAFLSL